MTFLRHLRRPSVQGTRISRRAHLRYPGHQLRRKLASEDVWWPG